MKVKWGVIGACGISIKVDPIVLTMGSTLR